MQPPQPSQRFPEIDLARALAVLMMIAYHTAYDLAAYADFSINVSDGGWWLVARFTAALFIFLTGLSFVLQRQKMIRRHTTINTMAKRWAVRAGVILFWGMVITFVTYVFEPQTYVRFGILHLIGTGILLLPLFVRLKSGNILAGLLIIALGNVLLNYRVETPWLLPFGLMPHGFQTVDYFPLLPWFGVTLTGAGVADLFYAEHNTISRWWNIHRAKIDSAFKRYSLLRALAIPGRHSLAIYLIHQPIIVGLILLLKRYCE